MALEAVWPMLLCTRTKVILSLRSSPLVSAWLPAEDHPVSKPLLLSILARFTCSGAFLVGVFGHAAVFSSYNVTACSLMDFCRLAKKIF